MCLFGILKGIAYLEKKMLLLFICIVPNSYAVVYSVKHNSRSYLITKQHDDNSNRQKAL